MSSTYLGSHQSQQYGLPQRFNMHGSSHMPPMHIMPNSTIATIVICLSLWLSGLCHATNIPKSGFSCAGITNLGTFYTTSIGIQYATIWDVVSEFTDICSISTYYRTITSWRTAGATNHCAWFFKACYYRSYTNLYTSSTTSIITIKPPKAPLVWFIKTIPKTEENSFNML